MILVMWWLEQQTLGSSTWIHLLVYYYKMDNMGLKYMGVTFDKREPKLLLSWIVGVHMLKENNLIFTFTVIFFARSTALS